MVFKMVFGSRAIFVMCSNALAAVSLLIIVFQLLLLVRSPQVTKLINEAKVKEDQTKRGVFQTITAAVALILITIACYGATNVLIVVAEVFPHKTISLGRIILNAACAVSAFATAVVCSQTFPAVLNLLSQFQVGSDGSLEHTENYLLEIVEMVKESIIVLSDDLKILRGNDASKVLLGTGALDGTSYADLVHPQDLQTFQNAAQLVNSSYSLVPSTIEYRIRVKPPPGSPRLIKLTSSKHSSAPRSKVYCAPPPVNDNVMPVSPFVRTSSMSSLLDNGTLDSLAPPAEYVWVESTIVKRTRFNEDEEFEYTLEMVSRNINDRKIKQENQFATMLRQTEELGRLNSAKLRYLSCIAHDLKTPLQSFCYTLDLLLQTQLLRDQRELVEQANLAVDLMKLTISQTMDISKALTGQKLIPRQSTVFLSSIVQKVDTIIQGYSKEVPVSFHVAPFINDEIITDEEWLWQMLLNLLTNACKYTDKGSIKVSVSLVNAGAHILHLNKLHNERSPKGQSVLLFEVFDTGVGVRDAQLATMFDAFSQLQEGQVTGTGLGLFGVRMRAEGLQGTCGARHNTESSTGTGTVMWFAIPYLPDYSHASGISKQLSSPRPMVKDCSIECIEDCNSASAHSNRSVPVLDELSRRADEILRSRPLTAIVVEDTLTVRKLMERMLQQVGFAKVAGYENGSKGLDALMATQVDIVFSDVQMPIMTGPEMLSRFRKFEAEALATGARSKRQVVVAVTANGSELKDGSGGTGFDDVYPKPLSRNDIYKVITEFM